MDSERVHAAGKLARERGIDHAMALQPALSAEGFRYDIDAEMSLAAGPVAGMAFVPVRFILDVKALGCESVAQLFRDQIAGVHGKSMIPKSMPSGFEPMGGRCAAARPFAARKLGAQAAILIGLHPDAIKEWRVTAHRYNYAGACMAPSRLDRRQKCTCVGIDRDRARWVDVSG